MLTEFLIEIFVFLDYNQKHLEYLSLRNNLFHWISVCSLDTFQEPRGRKGLEEELCACRTSQQTSHIIWLNKMLGGLNDKPLAIQEEGVTQNSA